MTGILLCVLALIVAFVSLVLCILREGFPQAIRYWPLYLIVAVILTEFALLWGNIGVIYSHAGWTG
jgi:hypothetical protein